MLFTNVLYFLFLLFIYVFIRKISDLSYQTIVYHCICFIMCNLCDGHHIFLHYFDGSKICFALQKYCGKNIIIYLRFTQNFLEIAVDVNASGPTHLETGLGVSQGMLPVICFRSNKAFLCQLNVMEIIRLSHS